MISVMEMVGEKFEIVDVFIPEELLYALAMNEALPVLEPYFSSGKKEATGIILMAIVREDIHDFGKNIAINILRGFGFEIRDMRINLPIKKILEAVLNTDKTLWDYTPFKQRQCRR